MANFVINQTASKIQQILNKAESPDTTPTPNSQNLVESGGVKTYVDTQVAAGASITTASFAPSALEDSTEGITATDTAVPTSAAVKIYIDSARGVVTLSRSTALYTVNSNTPGTATLGNVPSGVYVFYYAFQYQDLQYKSSNNGSVNIKIGGQTIINQLTSSDSNWIDAGNYNNTNIPQLSVIDLSSGGGSVVLKVTRRSTYGGSNTVGARNVTLKFTKIG